MSHLLTSFFFFIFLLKILAKFNPKKIEKLVEFTLFLKKIPKKTPNFFVKKSWKFAKKNKNPESLLLITYGKYPPT